MTKRPLTRSAIAGFTAAALMSTVVFGYLTMQHTHGHEATDCVMTVLGTKCGEGWTPLAGAASHMQVVLTLTLAIGTAAAAVYYAARRAYLRMSDENSTDAHPPDTHLFMRILFVCLLVLRQRRWCALREKRDPALMYWAHGGSSNT